MQIWKDIEGCKGHCQIPNHGNVRSLKKDAFPMKGGYLKGYKIISLWKNGTGKMSRVHGLVAAAFIPNPENKPCIDHIDGDRANNHAGNFRQRQFVRHVKGKEICIRVINGDIKNENQKEATRLRGNFPPFNQK